MSTFDHGGGANVEREAVIFNLAADSCSDLAVCGGAFFTTVRNAFGGNRPTYLGGYHSLFEGILRRVQKLRLPWLSCDCELPFARLSFQSRGRVAVGYPKRYLDHFGVIFSCIFCYRALLLGVCDMKIL